MKRMKEGLALTVAAILAMAVVMVPLVMAVMDMPPTLADDGVPAASGQMQIVDMGSLVASYPLANGGVAIVVLSDNAAPRLFLDYVPGDGQPAYRDREVSLMEKPPDKIITSASGPYVHITLNWTSGVKAPIVCHYRWTLPYGDRVAAGGHAVNQVFLPLLESP